MLVDLLMMLAKLFKVLFELFVFWSSCMTKLFGNLSFVVLEIGFKCGLGWGFKTWLSSLWSWPCTLSTLSCVM